jgi:hypothetical protein
MDLSFSAEGYKMPPQPLWGNVWQFLKTLNIHLPYDLAISCQGIFPREIEAYVHTKTCAGIFIKLYVNSHKVEITQMSINRFQQLWYIVQ